uniref:SOSEKI DIX-like domain-containing protein n=1 Tax=Kalanchoe fedtschenkoi TaxID=63787 RepID=A0A7N1A6J6_KALFE
MERRMSKYRQVSPERAKVWTERSPKYVQHRKVSVLYYLSKNQQLEHPHCVEVKISSPDGLYLRDFINRLNELRGRGMPSRYSWSCKRSYKSGFVWHDLSEDDLIHPSSVSEYVLKGSELIEESKSERVLPGESNRYQNLNQLPEPTSCRSRNCSSTSSSRNGKERTPSLEDAYTPLQHPGSCSLSPEYRVGKNASPAGHIDLVKYKVEKSEKAADASTQTDENPITELPQETCTRSVSTEDGSLIPIMQPTPQKQIPRIKTNSLASSASGSPPSCSSESPSARKTETLESLIRADAKKMNCFRILEEEDTSMSSNVRSKTTNLIMQMISCGSMPVRDHSLGPTPTNKPRSSTSKSPSPLYSSSVFLGELDYIPENTTKMGPKLEEKDYFTGSLIETKMLKEIGGLAALNRSSSFDAERTFKLSNADEDKDEVASKGSKCIPLSIKTSLTRHPRSESMRSPFSERPRISSESDRSLSSTTSVSVGNSKRIVNLANKKASKSPGLGSFREGTKIEERRLPSSARVTMQPKVSSELLN